MPLNILERSESKSPILNHLTRQRAPNPVKRTPSRKLLRSSFDESDYDYSGGKKDVTMNKKPGPPVLKKPVVAKKPEVAKKPLILPSNSSGNASTAAAFRENLNRKLSIPQPLKQPQENGGFQRNGPTSTQYKNLNSNVNSFAKDIENALNKKNSLTDNPKSDRTISLTEVSTLKTEDKSTKMMMNDTLEMMTDEGFDTTTEDQINFNGDIDLSPDEDDEELFANFNIPPPPPPAVDFSDSEWDDSFKEKVSLRSKTQNLLFFICTIFPYS